MIAADNRRGSRGAAVLRALFGYLFLAWVLIKLVATGGDGVPLLLSSAIVIGFPLVAVVARVLHRHGHGWLGSGRSVALAAIGATMLVPLACLVLHRGAENPSVVQADEQMRLEPATLIDGGLAVSRPEHLRLRIRGLTLLSGSAGIGGGDLNGELLLNTSIREHDGYRELVILVELFETASGRLLWREQYSVPPDDLAAIHRQLLKALSEAMRRTREGLPPGQLV